MPTLTAEERKEQFPTVSEQSAAEQAQTGAASETAQDNGGEQPKRKGGFQKKIDRLTAKVKELETELQTERGRQVRTSPEEVAETTETPAAGAKPDPKNFKTVEEYIDALSDWKLDQKLSAKDEADADQAENQRLQAVYDSYNRKAIEAETELPDYRQVVGRSDIKIPPSVQLAVFEMENGPYVAYHLGQHPEVCEKLMEMSPLAAVMEITRIAQGIKPEASAEDEEDEQEEVAPPEKQRQSPPPPPRTVAGSAARSSVPRDKMDPDEYIAMRQKEQRGSRRH